MKKILISALVGLGLGISTIAFAGSVVTKNFNVWNNGMTAKESGLRQAVLPTSEVNSFEDGNNICYILQSAVSKEPISISCVKN